MPAVEVNNLQVTYGQFTAVDELSFTAEYGEATVILGPNGAGKTTTIECCEGYRSPDAGSVRVGVMLQGAAMQAGARPIEVLRQYAAYYATPLNPQELLERVGLGPKARTNWRHLSGGERQRLSLAMALVGRPRVVFLDEPSAGIDIEGRLLIRDVLKSLKADGVCVIVTTHDLDDAERSADRIVIIDKGKAVADGRTEDLLASGSHQHVMFSAPEGLSLGILGAALGCRIEEVSPGEYLVPGEPSAEFIAQIATTLASEGVRIGDIRGGRQRLDDLFLQLTKERSTAELPVIDASKARK